jgi:hypothetical protein
MDQQSFTLLTDSLHQCRAIVDDNGSLLASLGMAGLIGGATHCTGMCGPFVLSQVAARLEAMPAERMREWHRLSGAALVPYHLGRATTYAVLGAAGGALVSSLASATALRWVSGGLLLVAAALMLGMAMPAVKRLVGGDRRGENWWTRTIGARARPLFGQPVGWRGYLLGIMLGFIPCGLVYGALAAATASGSPLAGAAGMVAFAAGTVPWLAAVGFLGHLAGSQWRHQVLPYAPLLLLANAGVLTWLAWRHIA